MLEWSLALTFSSSCWKSRHTNTHCRFQARWFFFNLSWWFAKSPCHSNKTTLLSSEQNPNLQVFFPGLWVERCWQSCNKDISSHHTAYGTCKACSHWMILKHQNSQIPVHKDPDYDRLHKGVTDHEKLYNVFGWLREIACSGKTSEHQASRLYNWSVLGWWQNVSNIIYSFSYYGMYVHHFNRWNQLVMDKY